MISTFSYILIFVSIAVINANEAQKPQFQRSPSQSTGSNVGGSSGITIGANNAFDAKLTQNSITGTVTAGVGGNVGSTAPQQYYTGQTYRPYNQGSGYYAYSHAIQQPPQSSLWSNSNINYYVASAVFVIIFLGYSLWSFFFLSSGSGLKAAADVLEEKEPTASTKDKIASKKSRRRREIRTNEEAARLARIVLSAIESGECLQKSICLMGSELGKTIKGKVAMNVLEKLIPGSLQTNNYFTVLQKAVRGQATCEKMKCKY